MTNKNKNPSDSELEPGSSKLFKSLSEEMKLIDSFISDPNKIADLNFQDCFDIIHKCCTIIDKRSLAKYAQVIDTAATTMNNLFVNLSSNIDHNAMDTKNLLQDIKNKLFSPVPYNVIAAKPKENNVPTIQSKPNEYALFVNAKKGMVDANLNSEVNNAISEVRKKKPYLKINKIIRNNKGNIIKTPNSDDLDTLIQYFQSQDKINEIANVFIPKPRDPTIVLKKVSKLTSSKDLPNILCRVNEQISNLDTEVEVLFDFRSDLPFRDIALRVSPRIYERICNLNYLYTDIEAIRFHQRIFVRQCKHCFKFNDHKANDCPRKNKPICSECGEEAFKSYTLPASSSSLKIIQQNLRKSLTAHNELKSSITNDNIDILALQEPYLFNNVFPFSISSRIFHSNMLNGVIYNGFVILNNNLIVEHLMNTYWHDVIVNKNGYKLKEIIDNHDLIVINDKTKTCRNASIIDLTITNSKAYNYIANWSVSRATELSDHETIKFHIVSSNDEFQKHVIKSTWKFIESNIQDYTNHIDIDKLQELNCFIDSCSSPNDINVAVSKLSNIYLEAAYCTFSVRNSSPYPKKYSWWTNDLELQKRHFHFIKNLYYRRSCLVTQDDYKRIRNSYIKNVRLAKRASFRSFLEEADSNNHFVIYYESIVGFSFPDDDPSSDNTFSGGIRNHTLNLNNHTHISFSIDELVSYIKKLNSKKAPGLDFISNNMIKASVDLLAPSILSIFNKCIQFGYFPDAWKLATVRVLAKPNKSDYNDVKSYRPISLISHIAKLFEKLINNRIYRHFESYMNTNQHGFVRGKSTVSALKSIINTAIEMKADKKVAIIAIDIQSAFDKAWWPAILYEMDSHNFPADLILIIKSYLTNRSINFDYADISIWKSLTNGCPQGGALSPLLWIILLNDLLESYNIQNSKIVAFADDITVICWADTKQELSHKIISCVSFIDSWCCSRKLLNSNIRVEPSDTIKILGITFGNHRHRNKINFTPHINNIVEKTGKICNILFALIGNTWGINSKKRIKLFIGMIRPAIVYGCHIWFNMIPVKSKLKLNSLQHQILVKAICAYRTISQNIVSVICDVCKLSDYCEILANTFDSDGLIKGLVREINSPECECGYEYQSPQHILFNCTFYNLNDHYISSASEFVNCKNNFLLFNYICKQYINMKL
ncbi:hypothetical protein DERP_004821 [Dermatophagoides pteronyssinus]|uniref:Reverse transcriptase domain-containing protein n=1 Tax=Dermatophagoides pteronyssinus TaxID=6956 RepID=A0ABQ8JTM8_DERPT|nr:hypothetical protein DERP_004821 [Dermatophagoides pteronyssinus]